MAKKTVEGHLTKHFADLLEKVKQQGTDSVNIKELTGKVDTIKLSTLTFDKVMQQNEVKVTIDNLYSQAILSANKEEKEKVSELSKAINNAVATDIKITYRDYIRAFYAQYSLVLNCGAMINAGEVVSDIYNLYNRLFQRLESAVKAGKMSPMDAKKYSDKVNDQACVVMRAIAELKETREVMEEAIRYISIIALGGKDSPYYKVTKWCEMYRNQEIKSKELLEKIKKLIAPIRGNIFVGEVVKRDFNLGIGEYLDNTDLFRYIIHSVALLKHKLRVNDHNDLMSIIETSGLIISDKYPDEVFDAFGVFIEYSDFEAMKNYIKHITNFSLQVPYFRKDGAEKCFEATKKILDDIQNNNNVTGSIKVMASVACYVIDSVRNKNLTFESNLEEYYKRFCVVAKDDPFYAKNAMYLDIYENLHVCTDAKSLYKDLMNRLENIKCYGNSMAEGANYLDNVITSIFSQAKELCLENAVGYPSEHVKFITDITCSLVRTKINENGEKEPGTNQELVKSAIQDIAEIRDKVEIEDESEKMRFKGFCNECIFNIGLSHYSNSPLREAASEALPEFENNEALLNAASPESMYKIILMNPESAEPGVKIARASILAKEIIKQSNIDSNVSRCIKTIKKETTSADLGKIGIKALADILEMSENNIAPEDKHDMKEQAQATKKRKEIAASVFDAFYEIVNAGYIDFWAAFEPIQALYNSHSVWHVVAMETILKLRDSEAIDKKMLVPAIMTMYGKVSMLAPELGPVDKYIADIINMLENNDIYDMLIYLTQLPLPEYGFLSSMENRVEMIYEICKQKGLGIDPTAEEIKYFFQNHKAEAKERDDKEKESRSALENDNRQGISMMDMLKLFTSTKIVELMSELEDQIDVDKSDPDHPVEVLTKDQENTRKKLRDIKQEIDLDDSEDKVFMKYVDITEKIVKVKEDEINVIKKLTEEEKAAEFEKLPAADKVSELYSNPMYWKKTCLEVLEELEKLVDANPQDASITGQAFNASEKLFMHNAFTTEENGKIIALQYKIIKCYPMAKPDNDDGKLKLEDACIYSLFKNKYIDYICKVAETVMKKSNVDRDKDTEFSLEQKYTILSNMSEYVSEKKCYDVYDAVCDNFQTLILTKEYKPKEDEVLSMITNIYDGLSTKISSLAKQLVSGAEEQ